jgi:hypothetical protein
MNNKGKWLFALGMSLLVFVASNVFSTAILFFFGCVVTKFNLIVGAVCAVGYLGLVAVKELGKRRTGAVLLVACVVVCIAIISAGQMVDYTYDGNTNHKLAAGLLKDGWNPYLMSAGEFANKTGLFQPPMLDTSRFVESYPKATWYFAASVYALTGNIESGKAFNLLIGVVVFCLVTGCLTARMPGKRAVAVGLAATANPMWLTQFCVNYLDGFATSAFMLAIFLLAETFDEKLADSKKAIELASFVLTALVLNTKVSYIVFAGCIYLAYFVFSAYKLYKQQNTLPSLLRLFYKLVGVAVGSLCLVGFSPFVTNTIRYGNPLANNMGFSGTPNDPIAWGAIPGVSNAGMFLASLFGKTSYGEYQTVGSLLKMPFTFSPSETYWLGFVDVRMGGMGVLFSGIFLLSLIVIVMRIVELTRGGGCKNRIPSEMCLFVLIVSLFPALLILPMTFHARYIAFIWIVPVAALTVILQNRKPAAKISSLILLICVAVNNWYFIKADYVRIQNSALIQTDYKQMAKANGEQPIKIYLFENFAGYLYNLRDAGITDFEFVPVEQVDASFTVLGQESFQYKIVE